MEEYKSFFDYNTLEQVLIYNIDTINIIDNYIKYIIHGIFIILIQIIFYIYS